MRKFALVGNPNCGKTTLFNSLTGSTAHVGNWPGVTVDKKQGTYKKLEEEIEIIDLPGIYSLSPYTPEEVISRNYILNEEPDCLINIVDATNLERNLYLTTQLLEINIPIIIALNMIDEIEKNGDNINIKELENKIGVPVIKISALKQSNLDVLMSEALKTSKIKRVGKSIINIKHVKDIIEEVTELLKEDKVQHPIFHAIKLIENDELEVKYHSNLLDGINESKKKINDQLFGDDYEALIADARYKFITEDFHKILKRKFNDENHFSKSDKIDKVLTNKYLSIPIFLFILFIVFHLTFTENLFFLGFLFKNVNPSFADSIFEGLFWTTNGINSPGVMLTNFVNSITVLLGNFVRDLIVGLNASTWVEAFICDGILEGLFAVLRFLPQILCLFMLFSILEDSGYMARVAFILDRLFRKFGLSGRAFMPMIMGFGCSVPAMINTRTLSDDKEKIATIRVIPFFSCSAKLPILTAISGAIVSFFGVGNVDLITYGMYLIGIITAIIAILIMKHTTLRGETPPFIMELPNYHLPQFKSLIIHLWDKAKHFIQKAFTVILASTIFVWFISHFSWTWQFLDDAQMGDSILASIGQFIQPIFTPLGFGSQLNAAGWIFAVAAITGLIAKENVIATIGTLAVAIVSGFGGGEFVDEIASTELLIQTTGITIPGLLSFIAFNMTTIPCFAACATARAELSRKKFIATLGFWLVTSFIVSTFIFLIGTWWWVSIIFIALLNILFVCIYFYNKKRPLKG